MPITSYRDLDVYRRSIQAVVAVHKLQKGFPEYERYALADQVRRASRSVPTNIAEGYGRRKSIKDFKHFLTMALGSSNEMIVHLEITRELGYAALNECNVLMDDYTVICKMLYRLIENWRSSPSLARPPTTSNPLA
jgi:four helix bundle protein